MDYPVTEIAMNDRFEQIEIQIDDLRRNKAGIELRDEMNYRFAETREYMKMRFDVQEQQFKVQEQHFQVQEQHFKMQERHFSTQDRRMDTLDQRLDAQAEALRSLGQRIDETNRTMLTAIRWIISSQIGIALTIFALSVKIAYG